MTPTPDTPIRLLTMTQEQFSRCHQWCGYDNETSRALFCALAEVRAQCAHAQAQAQTIRELEGELNDAINERIAVQNSNAALRTQRAALVEAVQACDRQLRQAETIQAKHVAGECKVIPLHRVEIQLGYVLQRLQDGGKA